MNPVRVLYVEDDQLWVEEVRTLLLDADVVHTPTPAEALRLAAEGGFDIALVDLGLAGDEDAGLRIVQELHALHPDLGVIVLTATTDLTAVKRSLQYGAGDFVSKAGDMSTALPTAVARALRFGRGHSSGRIETLTLVNFKTWREQRQLPMGRLTLFLGSNSAGKSTALQALLLLKQTTESADRYLPLQIGGLQAQHVDLGTFNDVVFGHDAQAAITLGLSWRSQADHEPIDFETTVGLHEGRLRVLRFHYRQGDEGFGMEVTGSKYLVFAEAQGQASHEVSASPPVKCYGFPPEALSRLPPALVDLQQSLQLSLEQQMERIYYLQPLRKHPARIYTWGGDRPHDIGVQGDRAIDALLALERDHETFSLLDDPRPRGAIETLRVFLERLGLADSFRLKQISPRQYEVRVVPKNGSVEAGLADLGFGLSQVLPILVLGLYAPTGAVVLLEQPELHLHPAAQVELGDVFIELAQRRDIQFIIETHSEHLLSRIQRRVAEERISSDDFQLYFCSRGKDGTSADALRLNTFGEIENWPPSFFGDPVEEAAERLRASFRR